MESSESSIITDDGNIEGSSVDALQKKKLILQKEIEDLTRTVQRLRKEINVSKIQGSLTKSNTDDVSNATNIITSTDIQLELYKYGGLYCMKFNNDNIVIGFNSSLKEQHKNEFAIEFTKKEKSIRTGKWVMPMSVDIEQLHFEIPIKSMRNVLHFIRNCKQHTDCHESRFQQFKELKSFADTLRNCNVQTNLGYTLVTLELLHVHDKANNSYFNISIYLWYNSKRSRPKNLKFEISGNTIYDKETEMRLKKSLKVFRLTDLRTAFDKIFNNNGIQFTWERVEKTKECDILETKESSSSLDEEALLYGRLSKKRKTKERGKTKLKKQVKRRKKQNKISNDLSQQDIDVEELNKPTTSKASLKVKSNIVKKKFMHQLTLDKFNNKLHLAKRKEKDFKIIENKYNIKPLIVKIQRLNEKYTSTPIKLNRRTLPTIDISKITLNDNYE